jgi:hypothetical protein
MGRARARSTVLLDRAVETVAFKTIRHSRVELVATEAETPDDGGSRHRNPRKDRTMSLGLILVIVLIVFLLGGFSGRFGGYGYGYGHGGIGIIGIILIILVVLLLMGRI